MSIPNHSTIHKCPKVVKAQLLRQCKEIGLFCGDTIMVHASMRSVGEILGGPDVLIAAILDTLDVKGNMMMYVGCHMPFDEIGRGRYSAA